MSREFHNHRVPISKFMVALSTSLCPSFVCETLKRIWSLLPLFPVDTSPVIQIQQEKKSILDSRTEWLVCHSQLTQWEHRRWKEKIVFEEIIYKLIDWAGSELWKKEKKRHTKKMHSDDDDDDDGGENEVEKVKSSWHGWEMQFEKDKLYSHLVFFFFLPQHVLSSLFASCMHQTLGCDVGCMIECQREEKNTTVWRFPFRLLIQCPKTICVLITLLMICVVLMFGWKKKLKE